MTTPKSVLAVAAHPDDLEYLIGGSVALWASQGADVYFLIVTNGANGTNDPSVDTKTLIQTRRSEQTKAAHILGVKNVYFYDYEDGHISNNESLKKDIVRIIRMTKPDTVITFDPTMVYTQSTGFISHPDHREVGQATLDAVYPLARDHLSFPELERNEHLSPHKVTTVLLCNFEKHNFSVNITSMIEKKCSSVCVYTSQIPSEKMARSVIIDRAKAAGKTCDCQYAEQFIRLDLPAYMV